MQGWQSKERVAVGGGSEGRGEEAVAACSACVAPVEQLRKGERMLLLLLLLRCVATFPAPTPVASSCLVVPQLSEQLRACACVEWSEERDLRISSPAYASRGATHRPTLSTGRVGTLGQRK